MKREDLPLVTPEKFKKFGPCWLKTREGCARFERIAAVKDEWSALDVLDLEDVSARDKLWSVLREEFLPSMLLHEFACRCAEWALSFVDNPDPRSADAIRVKRLWMTGDVTDCELRDARVAAREASLEVAARFAEAAAAWAAVCAASRSAESAADMAAARAAERFAGAANETAAYEHEVEIIRNLIDEWEE